jgi:hypothetical protein
MTADYVVVRAAPDLPDGFLPDHLEGRWYDLAEMPAAYPGGPLAHAVAVPVDRFEVRDDGAVAQVWEVRP